MKRYADDVAIMTEREQVMMEREKDFRKGKDTCWYGKSVPRNRLVRVWRAISITNMLHLARILVILFAAD